MTGAPAALLATLADRIAAVALPHPTRVAIDGVDAAGKTTLADALAPVLRERGRTVIRASIDGFHHPRVVRYRRGADSPEGYYRDSFDVTALRRSLLDPLGPGGDLRYVTATFDYRSDAPVVVEQREAPGDAILLFDGVFLLRPQLVDAWDLRIFLDVDLDVALERAVARDATALGGPEAALARYQTRYAPGQQLYLREADPRARADVVVDPSRPSR